MTDFYKNNDEQLRNKLTQHEFEPVSSAWDNMSKLLDQQQVVPKRAAAWWWSMPLVAAAALTGIIAVGFNGSMNEQPLTEQQNTPLTAYNLTTSATTTTSTNSTNTASTNSVSTNIPTILSEQENSTVVQETVVSTKNSTSRQPKKSNKAKTVATVSKNTTENTATSNTALINAVDENKDINNTLDASNENAEQQAKRVKTTRTIVRYQYSITPLRALQEKRNGIEPINTIGSFGIGNDVETKKSPVKIGVFGGVSTKVYGQTQKLSMMPYVGVTASCKVAARHAIQTGLQYKSMGQIPNSTDSEVLSYMTGNSTSSAYSMTRIDMLEIPLIYQFYPHQNCNIQAGIKGSYLFHTETSNAAFNNKSNDELGISNFDIGLVLGVEYCFNRHWSMAIQYSLGFINLTEKAQQKQNEAFALETAAGFDTNVKADALSSEGELIVPIGDNSSYQEMLRLPNQLHNNDVQLLLKYTF